MRGVDRVWPSGFRFEREIGKRSGQNNSEESAGGADGRI